MLKITHLVLLLVLVILTIHGQRKRDKPGYCSHDIHTILSCSCPKYYKPFCAGRNTTENQTASVTSRVTLCRLEPDYESLMIPTQVSVQCVKTFSYFERNPWSVPHKQASAYIPFLDGFSHIHAVSVSKISTKETQSPAPAAEPEPQPEAAPEPEPAPAS
ncbi:hypothetical protein ILUMI_26035 [Ignelater luminosus]|uniref:Uncharacterized protein n=1 Tax=Ignelater luminosus TaxID=2038154 RepID=A0A8K0C7B0_IGNLU|nr:hypothetical protein ILUMI_26035 [Ignelater luminosus]